MEIPLFRKFPALNAKIPYIPLGQYPTEVQSLERFSKKTDINLWIKRDDMSGQVYGGNKVRKLEFLLADAKTKGKKHLIVVGAVGSNYVTATGIYGKKLGFSVSAVLFHQPPTDYLKSNLLVNQFNGVDLNLSPHMLLVPFTEIAVLVRHGLRESYLTPPGGSSALSTLGYVNAALELKEQIDAGALPEPDYIFVPLGTGGTIAGLVLGCKLAGLKIRVVGVRVVDKIISNSLAVKRYADGCAKLLSKFIPEFRGLRIKFSDFTVLHDHFGSGYAHFTDEGIKAVKILYGAEGIKLEGTYTGKTLAGMLDFVKKNNLESKDILFWNTYNSRKMHYTIKEGEYTKLPDKFYRYFKCEEQKIFD